MKQCSNCLKTHGPLKRYMWNINHNFDFKEERQGRETQRKGKPILKSESGILCEVCAKGKGAWQTVGQGETIIIKPGEETRWIESIEDTITIGTSEEAERVAMSLTDEDIERLEREEKYSSLN